MNKRKPAGLLALSTFALAGWIAAEGFSDKPYIPTKGDVPTIGHGATHYEDGTRVTLADKPITRQRAAELAANLLDTTYAKCVRESLGSAKVSQTEFDLAVDFAGQYGCGNWRNSSMLRAYKQAEYKTACNAYLKYKYVAGYDCSTPGNKRCAGVWTRQLKRHAQCMGGV